tara:strand:+ start:132 stop:470 length:339 start_codon:yes stop_codon:yes gene_type:complete
MLKKILITASLIFIGVNITAQEIDSKKNINKVHKQYKKELKLTKIQSKNFKLILSQQNPKLNKLIDNKAPKIKINKQIKIESLEIFKILTRKQFSKYKELKKVLEEYKKYRK